MTLNLFKVHKANKTKGLCKLSAWIFIFSLLFAIPYSLAFAQTRGQLNSVRGIAEPARAAEESTPITQPIPTPLPEQPIGTLVGVLPKEVASIKLVLKGIHIKNPLLYCEENLIAPFKSYIGKTITLGDVQKFANDLTKRYQDEGYLLTQVIIPEQNIKDGVVTFEVISGYIDKIIIKGIDACPATILASYGEAIQDCYPLHVKTLERYALLANDVPGMEIKTILSASKTTSGATDLIFDGCQNLEEGTVNVNNTNSQFLGPFQAIFTGDSNSLINPGDQAEGIFVTSANKKLNYGQLRYSDFLDNVGSRYNFVYRYVQSKPGYFLETFDVRGINKVYSIDFSVPYIRTREENLYFQAGFMVLDDRVEMLRQLLYDDRIRPVHFGFSYNKVDDCQGVNQYQLLATQGLKIFNPSEDRFISRPNGESGFSKLNGMFARTQALFNNFSLYFMLTGQYAFDPLLVASQFSFGGRDVGKGYDPSELLGDSGVASNLELRYDLPNPTCVSPYLNFLQPYLFYEAGKVWNKEACPPPQTQGASSGGVGLRFQVNKCVTGNLYVARPLTKPLAIDGRRNVRAFFSITMKF